MVTVSGNLLGRTISPSLNKLESVKESNTNKTVTITNEMVTIDSIKPPQMGLAEKSLIPKSKEDLNSILKELSTDGNSIGK